MKDFKRENNRIRYEFFENHSISLRIDWWEAHEGKKRRQYHLPQGGDARARVWQEWQYL